MSGPKESDLVEIIQDHLFDSEVARVRKLVEGKLSRLEKMMQQDVFALPPEKHDSHMRNFRFLEDETYLWASFLETQAAYIDRLRNEARTLFSRSLEEWAEVQSLKAENEKLREQLQTAGSTHAGNESMELAEVRKALRHCKFQNEIMKHQHDVDSLELGKLRGQPLNLSNLKIR